MEVAGLVLGALPVLLKALSQYQTSIGKLERSIEYHFELKKLIRSIREQKVFFEDYLGQLIRDASRGAIDIRDTDDYNKELWSASGRMAKEVREYLGPKKYSLLEDTVREFENCLVEIGTELDHVQRRKKRRKFHAGYEKAHTTLSDIEALATTNPEKSNFFTKRLQFLIREEKISHLLQELDRLTLSIGRLLDASQKLHKQVESHIIADTKGPRALATMLQQIRERAARLYWAFHQSWKTACSEVHETMIYLDSPAALPGKAESIGCQTSSRFRILVREKSGDNSSLMNWHETIVTVEEGGDNDPNQSDHSGSVNNPSIPQIVIPMLSAIPSPMDPVDHLCKAIMQARDFHKSLGLTLHETFVLQHTETWPACTVPMKAVDCQVMTLEEIISQKRFFMPASKVLVALKLATSLLQFDTTQWLQDWTHKGIQFFGSHGDEFPLDLETPLTSQVFHQRASPSTVQRRPRPMFLDLGILLLEIWAQRTFDQWFCEHRQSNDEEDLEDTSRAERARAWYDEERELMTVRYGKVVLTCIDFAFELDQGRPGWDNDDLRLAVCAKIIQPLREECETFPRKKQKQQVSHLFAS